MADYDWPADLVPYAVSFYLQPHTGGTESPFSRVTKTYGLSAPRWICSMSFRGGYWGSRGLEAIGPRLDGFLAKLKGRQNRVRLYDFRRPWMRSPNGIWTATNLAAVKGDTSMTLTNTSGAFLLIGDYIGGDGRPHIIVEDAWADESGNLIANFEPPLSSDVAAGAAIFGNPTGLFRLISDDAGQNGTEVGSAVQITLDFVEDL